MDRNVDVLEVSENSLATTTIKNLVVIDIRGSVTLLDWGNDIVTQFAQIITDLPPLQMRCLQM